MNETVIDEHEFQNGAPQGVVAHSHPHTDRITQLYRGEILNEESAAIARDRIHWMCSKSVGRRVLDVGCSQGIASVLLARDGFQVTAIDPEPAAIAFARAEFAREPALVRARVELLALGLFDVEPGLCFDTVLLGEVVEHQVSPYPFVQRASQHVALGGRLVLTTPFGYHPHEDHKAFVFPLEIVEAMLSAGLALEHLSIDDGYIRCVGVRSSEPIKTAPDLRFILSITERACIASQKDLFARARERLNTAKRSKARVTDLEAQLQQARESATRELIRANQEFERRLSERASEDAQQWAEHVREREQLRTKYERDLGKQLKVREDLETQVTTLRRRLSSLSALGHEMIKRLGKSALSQEQALTRLAGVQRQLSYRLGSTLVDGGKHPRQLHKLPRNLYMQWKDFQETRTARTRIDEARQRDLWFTWDDTVRLPRMASVQRVPRWVDVSTQGRDQEGLQIVLNLSSFGGASHADVALYLLAIDSQGRSLPFLVNGGGDAHRVDTREGHIRTALKSDLEAKHRLRIMPPQGCASLRFSTVREGKHPVLLTLESIQWISDFRAAPGAIEGIAEWPAPTPDAAPADTERVAVRTRRPRLKVLSLLDAFTETCLRDEFTLIPLDRARFAEQLRGERPAFFFAESVWRGNRETWKYCMTKFGDRHGDDLRAVLTLCREHQVPTVFWNKEDPANFEVFIEVAKHFDHVFTTDEGCVERYKSILGHDRVYALPFAAQSTLHHPIRSEEGVDRVAFAGSWNGVKYPARAAWLDILLREPLQRRILDIYDRYADATDPKLRFPERFAPAVRGALPYEELIESVYRGYRALINVNSVEDSNTMVARRVFEIVACGTPVISSPSPALESTFEGVVAVVRDESEVTAALDQVGADPLARLKRSTLGVRLVHGQHTYGHRVRDVCRHLGVGGESSVDKAVTCVVVSKRPGFLAHVAQQLNRQSYPHIQVVFVAHAEEFDTRTVVGAFDARLSPLVLRLERQATLADGLNLALQHAQTSFIAKIDDDDHYGAEYLSDQMLAFDYSNAGLVGKASYFAHVQSQDRMVLRFANRHYTRAKLVHGGTLVWDRRETGDLAFTPVRQGTDTLFLKAVAGAGIPIVSTDPFNFVHVRYANPLEHTWKISDGEFLRKAEEVCRGLDLSLAFC